jgi:hypothetical protein
MNGRTRLAPTRRPLRLRHPLRLRWALPVVVACLALAGCGGGGTATSTPSASTSAGTSATQSAGLSAFQTCLKQHGVKLRPGASFSPRPLASRTGFPTAFPTGTGFPTAFPTGGFLGRGTGASAAALKACQKYAPKGFRFGSGGGISASAIAAFKSCMSQNGVKVTSTTFASLAKLVRSSKQAAKAYGICRVLLAQGFARPSPTPTT